MSVNVPFLDLKQQNSMIWDEIQPEMQNLARNAQFILGPSVQSFESAFAKYCGVKHCIGLNNGTTSLHMALLALGVGPGDEVITTPHSWISTSWGIAYTGAKPVFVDIQRDSYNIDPNLVEGAITPKTKAVLPVHLYGQCADMGALRDICSRRGLGLLEDSAQAHGAQWHGGVTGGLGDAGSFSFYPGKNLGAFGEGGCVTTNSDAIADRIRCLRDHAQKGRHNHVEIGFNTRMEGLQGLVLEHKLKHLPMWTQKRREHAKFYLEHLKGIPGLELPVEVAPNSHVWHLFVVLVENRDHFRDALEKACVSTGIHYPTPIPYQPAFADLGYKPGDFPYSEYVMNHCVSLPMFPELTPDQREHVVDVIKRYYS
jgi:dTDP-4-amino-4,6-dideoxygalactose transaminase